MNQTDFRTYHKLKKESTLNERAIPQSVLKSPQFQGLLSAKILTKEKSGRGFRIRVEKPDEYARFFRTYFPEDGSVSNKSDNVRKFRNSKIRKTPTMPIFMFRGFTTIMVDGYPVDLDVYTRRFKLFACHGDNIVADQMCIVENLDTFLVAERLLGKHFVYLHKYGRIGQDSLKMLHPSELLVFVDYDFNGLEEFLRIKEVFEFAQLFVPKEYDDLFHKYSQSLRGNKSTMSSRVKNSTHCEVVRIRESIIRNNRFLEQQYWKYD